MGIILQIGILLTFLGIGEFVVLMTHLPIPSSIIGMVLLAVALKSKVIKLEWVSKVSDFLTSNLAFFFVPAGIGLMNCLNILNDHLAAIVITVIVSTIIIIIVTGWTHQLTRKFSFKRIKRAWHF